MSVDTNEQVSAPSIKYRGPRPVIPRPKYILNTSSSNSNLPLNSYLTRNPSPSKDLDQD